MVKIKNEVRVGQHRLSLINKVAKTVLNDLNLNEVSIYVLPASEMQNVDGYCLNEYMIEIKNSRCLYNLIDTICHEIRHCWQHVTNKGDEPTTWKEFDAEKYAKKMTSKIWKKYKLG